MNGFTGAAGQLRAYQESGAWHLDEDTNGDGAAEFSLTVQTTSAWNPYGASSHLLL